MLNIFRDKQFRNELIRLAIPIIAQQVLVFLVNTSSTIIIKAILGPDAFNGTTSANDVFNIFNTILVSFELAGMVFAAQYAGKKDIQAVRKIFNLSLKICSLLSLAFMAICLICPKEIISAFTGGNQKIIEFGTDYLRIFSISFIFYSISSIYYYSIKSAKKIRIFIIASITTLVLNISLTSAFCYIRIGSNPSMGPAMATVISRVTELIILIFLTRKMEETRFSFRYFLHTEPEMLVQYFKYTFVLLLSRVFWGTGNMIVTKIIINKIEFSPLIDPTGGLTTALITANNTVSTVHNLVGCTNSGITGATSILIGRELGANDLRKANAHGKDVVRLLTILGLTNIVLSFAFAPIFMINANANIDPSELEVFNANFMNYVWIFSGIYAISYLAQAYNATLNDAFFTAGGDRLAMFIANGLFMWGVIVPLGFTAFKLGWHPLVIFAICKNEETVKCWANLLRFRQKFWVKNIVNKEANRMTNFEYKYNKNKKEVLVTFDYKTLTNLKFPVKIDKTVKDPIGYTKELLFNQEENKKLTHFADTYFRKNIN